MPILPGHSLDLYLVPNSALETPPLEVCLAALEAEDLVAGRRGGPRAMGLVSGGFQGVRLDRPGRLTLYANRQGGFRVSCPTTRDNVAPAFQAAPTAWRAGGPTRIACPSCGEVHLFDELVYAPAAAVGWGAVGLLDVETASVLEAGRAQVERVLGPVTIVGSRR